MGIKDVVFPLRVDFKKSILLNEPVVTQNDNIIFVVDVLDDDQPFDLSDISTFTLVSERPRDTPVMTVGKKTGENEITFDFGSNEVAQIGTVNATIQLYDVDGRVSAFPFTYKVRKDPVKDYLPSVNEETLIEIVLGQGPAILKAAEDATVEALQATTDLNQLKENVVRATSDANNAAEFASTEGNRASTQADRADTAATNAEVVYNAILPVLPNIEGWGYDPLPYDGSTSYEKNNIVSHEGSTFISLVDGNIGNIPSLIPNVYWGVIARKGVDGTGSVSSVNGVGPDTSGDVTLPEPNLSGLATKAELQTLDEYFTIRLSHLVVNVKDFGAIGDGITDDTVSIQSAIDSIEGDGIVDFPSGRYRITNTIILRQGISIKGGGTFSSTVQSDVQDITLFSMIFNDPTGANLSISDIGIYSLNEGIKGFQFTNCNRVHIKNVMFYGCKINAEFDRGGLNRIDDCVSAGTGTLKAGQLKLWSSLDTVFGCVFTSINNYRIENNGQGVQSPAIYFRRAVGVRCNNIITNDAGYTGTCLLFENDCQGITIENSIIVGYGIGAIFQQGTGVTNAPVYCTLSNVDFDQCMTNSILVLEGNWLHFNGGHITSSSVAEDSKAVVLRSPKTQWVRFTDVQIAGYRDNSGTAFLIDGTNYVSITGCMIDQCNQGIALLNANTNLQIKDNTILRTDFPMVGDQSNGVGNIIMNNKGLVGSDKVATPLVPLSDVGIKNVFGYPVRIYIYGGTVSMIKIDDQGAIFNGGFVMLMPNETLKLVYSVAPNWNWIGI